MKAWKVTVIIHRDAANAVRGWSGEETIWIVFPLEGKKALFTTTLNQALCVWQEDFDPASHKWVSVREIDVPDKFYEAAVAFVNTKQIFPLQARKKGRKPPT